MAESIGKILPTSSVIRKLSSFESKCLHCGKETQPLNIGGKLLANKCCPDCFTSQAKVEQYQKLSQMRQAKHTRLKAKINAVIPPLYKKARLCHLNKTLRNIMLSLPHERGLMLTGPAGVGKTYAMAALIRFFLMLGRSIIRVSFDRLCLQIRDAYKPTSTRSEAAIIREFENIDLLFIEDLGTTVGDNSQESDWSLRTLLLILDYRLEHLKPTFITSNKTVEELANSFDKRLVSRLYQACQVIPVSGKDKRIREALGEK